MSDSNDFSLPEELNIPDEFYKIINDFINDIKNTFPEYNGIINKWWSDDFSEDKKKIFVYKHCIKNYPERFFDILYKNNEIFTEESNHNTEFLPGIVFKHIWNCDITDKTKETIWRYLQLILFSVIGSVRSSSELGNTAKIFENMNEEELRTKLEEALGGMKNVFENEPSMNSQDLPSAEDVHNHINNMMEGKLGKLAMELAEETAEELDIDMENATTSQEVFQKLFANPGKLMNMVKNVGEKIDEKMKSGEIKESELIAEGVEMLNKMKNMPGMDNMQEMFSKLGIPGLGKNTKVNTGAMEAQLNKNLKMAQMKERMKANLEKKKNKEQESTINENIPPLLTEEQLISIFSTGEKVDKTPRVVKSNNKKKNKNKK